MRRPVVAVLLAGRKASKEEDESLTVRLDAFVARRLIFANAAAKTAAQFFFHFRGAW
jgi:hypothetical protein